MFQTVWKGMAGAWKGNRDSSFQNIPWGALAISQEGSKNRGPFADEPKKQREAVVGINSRKEKHSE